MLNPDLIDDFKQLQAEYLDSVHKTYSSIDSSIYPEEITFHAVERAIKVGDALWIAEALENIKPKNMLEIGSFFGLSSRWILDRTQNESPKLTSIDPNIAYRAFEEPRKNFNIFCAKYNDRLKTIDAFFSFSDDNHPSIPIITEPFDIFDFAFIDGDHCFEATLLNTILAARMMPQGGLILIHNILHVDGIAAAIETLAQATSEHEIEYYAVTDFYIKRGFSLFSKHARRKWNHRRRNRKYIRRGSLFDSTLLGTADRPGYIDGLAIIKIKNNSKFADLNLDSLLAKKDEMLPKHLEILAKRRLSKGNLIVQLRSWGYR